MNNNTKIKVSEMHAGIPEDVRENLMAKLEELQKFYNQIISIDIHFAQKNQLYSLNLIAHLPRKKIIKASHESHDLNMTVQQPINAMKRQLKDFKEKLGDHQQEKILNQQLAQESD